MKLGWLLACLGSVIALTFFSEDKAQTEVDVRDRAASSRREVSQTPGSSAKLEPQRVNATAPALPELIELKYLQLFPANAVMQKAKDAKGMAQKTEHSLNAFSARTWVPVISAPPARAPIPVQLTRSLQSAPPTISARPEFEYIGAMDAPGGGRFIFLSKGTEQFSVKEGDTMEGIWKVEALKEDRLVIRHTTTNAEHILPRYLPSGSQNSGSQNR